MTKLARAHVRLQRFKDKQQDKKLRKLELETNKALRNTKRNEQIAVAREKASNARAKEAAAKRRMNAERTKRNEKALKSIKKFGKSFIKGLKKQQRKRR